MNREALIRQLMEFDNQIDSHLPVPSYEYYVKLYSPFTDDQLLADIKYMEWLELGDERSNT